MAANPKPLVPTGKSASAGPGSKEVLANSSSNELFFAVVGHVGSGTSEVAKAIAALLKEKKIQGQPFDVEVLKARAVIEEWAKRRGTPVSSPDPKTLSSVEKLQNHGDDMRRELRNGRSDPAAVARGLISEIRKCRAHKLGVTPSSGAAIKPDGRPRAYVLDSIRHPEEVNLLRRLYEDAFVLVGVFCEPQQRTERLRKKYPEATQEQIDAFMQRDADSGKEYGQHVADAFHLSDFFANNTPDRAKSAKWNVNDEISRLIKIVSEDEIQRPRLDETAMYQAYSAQMQSACLSRQVGAALVDSGGNIIAVGTNEAPKAGGGVYGESLDPKSLDCRCAMFEDQVERYCRNTQEQNRIIKQLIATVPELNTLPQSRKDELTLQLRKTSIGNLLEFSRAVHAEMDALLSAGRKGSSLVGTRLFVTTFPCHFCARHIITAGVDEVQFIEPYPKSLALRLHSDAIITEPDAGWERPSVGGKRVLFHHFSGVSPRLYKRAFLKDRDLKDKNTGIIDIQPAAWGTPWFLPKISYPEMEAQLSEGA